MERVYLNPFPSSTTRTSADVRTDRSHHLNSRPRVRSKVTVNRSECAARGDTLGSCQTGAGSNAAAGGDRSRPWSLDISRPPRHVLRRKLCRKLCRRGTRLSLMPFGNSCGGPLGDEGVGNTERHYPQPPEPREILSKLLLSREETKEAKIRNSFFLPSLRSLRPFAGHPACA